MTYLDIRNSVVKQIQAAFANDKRVKVAAHPGNFDEGKELSEGRSIYVEGMTSKTGKHFNANLQFNADKRSIEFRFGMSKQEQRQRQAPEGQEQSEQKELRVPQKMLGRDISSEEQAKLKAGQTVYMTGLIDKKGEPFNAYVRPNFEKNKFDFLKWNPDKSQAKEVTPDNASRTQVAVNSEGKTNEATKHMREPLKQGQTEPQRPGCYAFLL